MKFLEKYRLIIAGAIFFGLTIPLAFILNIRQDEAYSLHTTSKGLVFAFKQAVNFEMQPPVYFMLLTAWRFIEDSIFWARLFSIISVFLSVVIIDRLLEGKLNNRLFLLLFLALHPVSVWAALEIRVYAFTLLTTSAYLYFFIKHLEPNYSNIRLRLIHVLLVCAGLFSYYYFGFVLAGVGIYILLFKRKILLNYLVDMALPALILLLSASKIFYKIEGHSGIGPIIDFSIQNIIRYWQVDFFDLFFLPVFFIGPNTVFNLLARGFFVAFIFFFIFSSRAKLHTLITNPVFYVAVVFVTSLTLIKFNLGSIYASHPHATLSLIPILITLILLIEPYKNKHLINVFFGGLLLISMVSHFKVYQKPYKDYDVRALTHYLKSVPADIPALIYTNETYEVLKYYIKDERSFIPLPKKITFQEYKLSDWVITNRDTLHVLAQQKIRNFEGRYFLYVSDNKQFIEHLCVDHQKLVKDYFLDTFTLIDSTHTGGFSVFKFSLY